jgi:hypothetical protein
LELTVNASTRPVRLDAHHDLALNEIVTSWREFKAEGHSGYLQDIHALHDNSYTRDFAHTQQITHDLLKWGLITVERHDVRECYVPTRAGVRAFKPYPLPIPTN